MSRWREVATRMRALVSGSRLDREFDEELDAHLDLLTDDLERRGLDRDAARTEARRQLGGVAQLTHDRQTTRGFPALEDLWRDVRYGLRVLRKRPQFTFAAVLVLTLGLGAVTSMFAVVDALVLRPLPYPDPDRLVRIEALDPQGGFWPLSQPDLLDFRERSRTLTIAGWQARTLSFEATDGPRQIESAAVSAAFFDLLGRGALTGRLFSAAEDAPGGPRVVVVSRAFWTRQLQQDPTIVGRPLVFEGQPYTVVGVLAAPVELLPRAEVFVPLGADPEGSRSAREVEGIARLRDGVAPGSAQAELVSLTRQLAQQFPASHTGWSARVVPFRDWIVGPQLTRMAWVLFGAVAALCLLACANVACLLLAQGSTRQQELAMRRALGAPRSRVVRQLFTESVCLAAIGAAGGWALAGLVVSALRDFVSPVVPQLADVRLSTSTLVCAVIAAMLTSVIAGLSPARAATGADLQQVLLRAGRSVSPRHRGRHALVIAQVAIATLLTVGATLLCASFLRLRAVDVGFDPSRALAIRVVFPAAQYDAPRRVARLLEILDRVRSLPGVQSAGASSVTPFSGFGTANQFRAEGRSADGEYSSAAWRAVTPGFFEALGLPLRNGRYLDARDTDGSTEVVVITEGMAQRFWPGENPVGRRLLWGRRGSPKMIVGVVGDYRDLRPDAEPMPTMFRPHPQLSFPTMTVIVRTEGSPDAVLPSVRTAIRAAAPDVPFEETAVDRMFASALTRPRVSAGALATFAGVAVLLAATGVYGLMSFSVAQRRREMAIRLALGARPEQLVRRVVRQSAILVGAGAIVGLVLSAAAARSLTALLYETSPLDLTVITVVALLLVGLGVLTTYGPARRAMRTSPAAVLNAD
jgi:putative ABC transport system permease protein